MAIKKLERNGIAADEIEPILSKKFSRHEIAEAKGFGFRSLDAPLGGDDERTLYDVIADRGEDDSSFGDEGVSGIEESANKVVITILVRIFLISYQA